jgi:hypothetical protein
LTSAILIFEDLSRNIEACLCEMWNPREGEDGNWKLTPDEEAMYEHSARASAKQRFSAWQPQCPQCF